MMDTLKPLSVFVGVNVPFGCREGFVDKISSQIEPFSLQKNLSLGLYSFPGSQLMVILAVLSTVSLSGSWQSFFTVKEK